MRAVQGFFEICNRGDTMEGTQCFELLLAGMSADTEEFVDILLSEREENDFLSLMSVSVNGKELSDYDDESEFTADAFAVDVVEGEDYSDECGFDKGSYCHVQLTMLLNSEEGELTEDFEDKAAALCDNLAVSGKYMRMYGRYYEFDEDEGDYTTSVFVTKDMESTDCITEEMSDPDEFPIEEFYACDLVELFGGEAEDYGYYSNDENYGYEED